MKDLASLRALPWASLVAIYPDLEATPYGSPQVYIPVLGETMPLHPVDATWHGVGSDLDYLIGSCRDEMNLFDLFPGDAALARFRGRRDALLSSIGVSPTALDAAYRVAHPQRLRIARVMSFRIATPARL